MASLGLGTSFSSNYNTNFSFDQNLLPDTSLALSKPLEQPNNKRNISSSSSSSNTTAIISGTKSLPSRNISLKQLPIPSNMLLPDVITPNNTTINSNNTTTTINNSTTRPPNVRSLSAHQSMNGRPISFQQQQQQPPLPSNSPYLQQDSPMSASSPNLASSKKPSFMRSIMTAVTSPRSSFRQSKLTSKKSLDTIQRNSSMSPQSLSAVSLDRAAAEAPIPPQHLTIPPPQSPFASRVNNQSTSSFISSVNSSSQSSLPTMTPPLSRSSSPGSVTPVNTNRYTSPPSSSSSSEDLGSPPESVRFREPLLLLLHLTNFIII